MKSFLRVSGALLCAVAALSLALVTANRYAASHGGHNLQNMLVPSFSLLFIGICLLIGCRFASDIR